MMHNKLQLTSVEASMSHWPASPHLKPWRVVEGSFTEYLKNYY